MPTSTAWLSRGIVGAQRGSSPVRPSEESIERLSPEPATTPVNIPTSSRVKRETNGQFLHGLGLSNTHLQDRTIPKTDGLYLDSNGRAHLGAKLKSPRQDLPATRTLRAPTTRYHGPPKRPHPSHARTPSAMSIDDLANIAIATSPQFAISHSRPSTSYIQGYSDVNDRAAKRIKSERLFSAQFLGSEQRPKSSREEDAELLLGLSRGFSFSKPFSSSNVTRPLPPAQPVLILQEHEQNDPLLHNKPPLSLEPSIELAPTDIDTSMQESIPESPRLRMPSTRDLSNPLASPVSHQPPFTKHIKSSPIRPPTASESVEKQEHSIPELETVATMEDQPMEKPLSETEATPEVQNAMVTAGSQQEKGLQSQSADSDQIKEMRRIPVEASQPVCPVCKQINSSAGIGEATTKWINCEGSCDRWFHINCAGFSDHEVKKIAKFVCSNCEPVHGQTRFARTSTRTRAAPDYAALNEGVTKSTEDADTHHFVSKFKDGTIKYHKDSFARIRPELLTKELWENFDGMKRPFVVPSIWNPRFGKLAEIPQPPANEEESTTMEDQKSYKTISSTGEVLGESNDPNDATSAYTTIEEPIIDLDQDYLGMIMPRDLTVRKVAALVGNVMAPVIDVMKQQGLKKNPTLSEWADYYDDKQKKEVRNVISLEISHSRLGRLIRRPEVVRQIDLQDQVWELDSKNPPKSLTVRKPVAFYCLMSVGDSFTDFHIDFGGSSVYYHILKGRKTFFFIPPTEKYLKKYEEWNNTPNQNSIWLGDWCDGNVTRVDLFPGDTAFIPAGWIHSVWTPEDSLVIGGNFLTRYDLDMQLKVVNIEKANGTPLMFRYPHFQRVMWYTLIKYLEDDPVPQTVIDDFLEDPDYAYVRPFPIWHSEANSSNPDIEPEEEGEELHQRPYSKSELRGLTPLRDYLYRTARIYADLPVKGKLDKAKNNTVKASVPKVYGDPMQLIREFAIFVAWVRGNETVPDWLYSDDDPTQEQDSKEVGKKVENFRIPGERVSTRRKTRKSDSPGPESRGSPDVEDKRESPTPKSLGPKVACAACRKKRPQQACRHATKFDETAQQTLERTRTYSNVSIDIAKLARASPVVNSIEGSTAPPKQAPQLAPPATTSVDEDTIELSTSSDVAQSTAARMTSPFDQNGIAVNGTPSTPSQSRDQPKKGRSKACDECRKSKRRCVHDEHGRVDPAKAAEPSKPRGSTSAKRPPRLSDEHQSKRVKLEEDYAVYGTLPDLDAMIDPALMAPADPGYGMYSTQPLIMTDVNAITTPPHTLTHQHSFASGPVQSPNIEQSLDPALMDPALLDPSLSQQNLTATVDEEASSLSTLPKLATNALAGVISLNTPDVDKSFSPLTAEEATSKAESEEDTTLPGLRPSVDRLNNVSIDPLDRSHTNGVVRETSNTMTSNDRIEESAKQTRDLNTDRDHLKRETTPHSTRSRRSNSRMSNVASSILATPQPPVRTSRQPSTPPATHSPQSTIELRHTPQTERFKRADSNSSSDAEEDASTKLARELHAQEHGLRRRPSIRTS